MLSTEYKGYFIDRVYDISNNFEPLDYYNVWTKNHEDLCSEKFPTMSEAKSFIDDLINNDSWKDYDNRIKMSGDNPTGENDNKEVKNG